MTRTTLTLRADCDYGEYEEEINAISTDENCGYASLAAPYGPSAEEDKN
jgi:hypothetical protein